MAGPFVYEQPVGPADLIDREASAHRGPLATMEAEGQIVRASTPTGWRLVDPLFALWLASGRDWPR